MNKVVIIGNGISGITAARHIRKNSNLPVTVISAESKYFWSRTALMYIYMGHMTFDHTKPYEDHFWAKNNIDLVFGKVIGIRPNAKSILLDNGETHTYSKLIIATGSRHNVFDWEGSNLDGITGMISLQDLEYIESYTKNISRGVIVGGGLIGIELAEMLRSRKIEVTMLVRERHFWSNVLPEEEAEMIDFHIREHGVDLRLNTEVKEFLADHKGRVRAVVTKDGEEITCQFAGLTAGVHPNLDLVKETDIAYETGILVNEYLETSVSDIYAIGDCAQLREPLPGRRAIEPVWYTGRMMGEVAAQNITGNKTPYRPGPWFNSAKLFDIEYQTYGKIEPECPQDEEELYWQHPDKRRAIHIRFLGTTKQLKGVNLFGIRMRHERIHEWLQNGITVSGFMNSLEDAGFDPEFAEDVFHPIRETFNEKFPDLAIKNKKKRRKLFGLIR